MDKKDQNRQKKRGIGTLIVGIVLGLGSFVGWLLVRMKPEDRKTMIKKVEQGVDSFYHRARAYVIPSEQNEYKPHIFKKESVTKILFLVLAVKIVTVSTLFILYPNEAKLNRDVTSQMYALINDYRSDVGTHPLEPNTYLESVALAKANDMIENNYFSHYGVDGMKPWQWIDTSVYDYRAMGENLAMDFITAGAVFKAFQNSPTHDKNLINEKYTNVGIAVRSGYLDGHETNIMVVFFGAPRDASIPTQVASATDSPTSPIVETETTGSETVAGVATPSDQEPVMPATEPEPIEPEPQPVPPIDTAPDPLPVEQEVTPDSLESEISPDIVIAPITDTDEDEDTVEVAANTVSTGVVFSQGSFVQRMISWSDRFLGLALAVVILLMMINIIVKIRVQHASVIANGFILIAVIGVLLYTNVHHAEAIGQKVRILGLLIL